MLRFLPRCVALMAWITLITSGFRSPLVAQQPAPARQKAWEMAVAISEVCPVPETRPWREWFKYPEVSGVPSGEEPPTWVELFNFGEEAVDMRGWCLADSTGIRYLLPEDLPPVPAQGLILVTFQGPASREQDDKDFEGDNLAHVYAREEGAFHAFRGPVGECALYASQQGREEDLVDYVCWGASRDTAIAQQISRTGLSVMRWPVFPVDPEPGEIVYPDGGSIGRPIFRKPVFDRETGKVTVDPSGDWDIYFPEAISPGKRNTWPSLLPHYPWPGATASFQEDEGAKFVWRWPASLSLLPPEAKQNWRDHIQVATDPEFKNLVVDAYRTEPWGFRPAVPPDPGKYYWRVRSETDTDVTPWSPIIQFTVVPPAKTN